MAIYYIITLHIILHTINLLTHIRASKGLKWKQTTFDVYLKVIKFSQWCLEYHIVHNKEQEQCTGKYLLYTNSCYNTKEDFYLIIFLQFNHRKIDMQTKILIMPRKANKLKVAAKIHKQ